MSSEAWELERRYSVPGALDTRGLEQPASEDLHAWSIYRQNLNSDFTDSALGSAEKSPLPYGNFQLRDSTVQSILRHPRYGPKSPLANNSYTYLKFGLPRVLPPSSSRVRDGSSGYDSSEEGRRIHPPSGGAIHQQQSESLMIRSARSDPDFRQVHTCATELGHSQTPSQLLLLPRDNKLKSASEANLVQATRPNRRHSIALVDPTSGYPSQHIYQCQAQGHIGPELVDYNSSTSMRRSTMPTNPPSHPHIQLRNIETHVDSSNANLKEITLEAGATDVMAIMSTTEIEGTTIIETISGRRRIKRGNILINGKIVTTRGLRARVAYLPAENSLSPGLTAQQILNFYMCLRGGSHTSEMQIEAILQELGLEATKHCLVSSLTTSEIKRLSLACRLLQDAHILTLDRPTHGLDIFDAFFLVEYLRQWAIKGQRLVVLTLHPPTYEILTMVSQVALTSGGRIMYTGARRDMLPYFALAEFPCPPFKNPSDYYLDLVTLDDLSVEAMLESSQRIDHLAELAKSRLPALSDPGPPGNLPPTVYDANIFVQIYALLLKMLLYSQPWAMTRLVKKIVMAASLSIILGAVFWDVAGDTNLYLRDNIGFYYAILGIYFWPLGLLKICQVIDSRQNVEMDIKDGLYGRLIYIIIELLSSFPSWCLIYIIYLGPAFAMSGLPTMAWDNQDFTSLWWYLSYGLLYLMFQHQICTLFAHICKWSGLASLLSGIIIGYMTLGGGITLHLENLPVWLKNASPMKWTLSILLKEIYRNNAFNKLNNCKAKQVQRQDIIVQAPCEPLDGKSVLDEIALDVYINSTDIRLGIGICIVSLFIVIGFLIIRYNTPKKPRSAPNKP